jgi:uncharacterized protein YcfL
MKLRMGVAVAAGVMGLVGGCRTTNDNVPFGARADGIAPEAYPGIAVEQPLQKFVVVDYPSVIVDRATAERPMRVQVPLRSTAYEQMSVQHNFTWYDAGGRQVGESGWRFVSLEPGLQTMLDGSARKLEAEKFRLEIRSAR